MRPSTKFYSKIKEKDHSSSIDLFLIECFRKTEFIRLPAFMKEHMKKIIYEKKIKHRMPYGYFPNNVFNYYKIIGTKGAPGSVKRKFSLTTQVKNEYIKEKVGTIFQVSELLVTLERMNKEKEELRIMLVVKDTRIVHLKLQY